MAVMRASRLICITARTAALLGVALPVSWLLAVAWASHGDGWRELLSGPPARVITTFARGLLSNDVTEAEDQLDFICFWIPSLMLTVAALAALWWKVALHVGRRTKQSPANRAGSVAAC